VVLDPPASRTMVPNLRLRRRWSAVPVNFFCADQQETFPLFFPALGSEMPPPLRKIARPTPGPNRRGLVRAARPGNLFQPLKTLGGFS